MSRSLIKKTHLKGEDLYFIQVNEYVKIGRANDCEKRLSQIKAMCPYPCVLLKVVKGKGHLEHEFHEKYKEYHHTGEWFRLPACEIVDIVAKENHDG